MDGFHWQPVFSPAEHVKTQRLPQGLVELTLRVYHVASMDSVTLLAFCEDFLKNSP